MNHLERVQTARLTLTRPVAQDLEAVRLLHGNADAMATLGGVRTPEQTRDWLASMDRHWTEHGFGPWIARETKSRSFVGIGGLRQVAVEDTEEIEIGYALAPPWWGQGLATELARAAAQAAFREIQLPALVSFTLPTNARSRRVMEKVGFKFERDFVYKGHPQVLYRLSPDMWRGDERR